MRFSSKILILLISLWWATVPVAFAGTLEDIRASGELLWGADAEGGAPSRSFENPTEERTRKFLNQITWH